MSSKSFFVYCFILCYISLWYQVLIYNNPLVSWGKIHFDPNIISNRKRHFSKERMFTMRYYKNAKEAKEVRDAAATKAVADIICQVRQDKDQALKDLAEKFDHTTLTQIRVSKEDIISFLEKDSSRRFCTVR